MINPAHYESEDGVFNLALYLYDSLRDVMKSEFDQIRSVVKDPDDADRVVRLIKNRYQTLWSQLSLSLFKLGLIEPCMCKPKEVCDKCHGAQWIMVKGLDYHALAEHSDSILRGALTRRMQSPEFEKALEYAANEVTEQDDDRQEDQAG
jgi:hypothetical protein